MRLTTPLPFPFVPLRPMIAIPRDAPGSVACSRGPAFAGGLPQRASPACSFSASTTTGTARRSTGGRSSARPAELRVQLTPSTSRATQSSMPSIGRCRRHSPPRRHTRHKAWDLKQYCTLAVANPYHLHPCYFLSSFGFHSRDSLCPSAILSRRHHLDGNELQGVVATLRAAPASEADAPRLSGLFCEAITASGTPRPACSDCASIVSPGKKAASPVIDDGGPPTD